MARKIIQNIMNPKCLYSLSISIVVVGSPFAQAGPQTATGASCVTFFFYSFTRYSFSCVRFFFFSFHHRVHHYCFSFHLFLFCVTVHLMDIIEWFSAGKYQVISDGFFSHIILYTSHLNITYNVLSYIQYKIPYISPLC